MSTMTREELTKLCAQRNIIQIGIMCEDIYSTMDNMINIFKLGPWDFYTHSEDTLQEPMVSEGICDEHFKFYCAVANFGNVQMELIQPLYGIPFYSDFLKKHGTGLHHIKEKVSAEAYDSTLQAYANMGMAPIFGARLFESRFCFVDTIEKYGILLEIGNGQSPSSVPPEWKKTYPTE